MDAFVHLQLVLLVAGVAADGAHEPLRSVHTPVVDADVRVQVGLSMSTGCLITRSRIRWLGWFRFLPVSKNKEVFSFFFLGKEIDLEKEGAAAQVAHVRLDAAVSLEVKSEPRRLNHFSALLALHLLQ